MNSSYSDFVNNFEGSDMNTSIDCNISRLSEGDFNMIVDHLLTKPAKSKRPKSKSLQRRLHSALSVPALNEDSELDTVHRSNGQDAMNATFADYNTSYVSLNESCFSTNSEQLDHLFAYFNQDVSTNDLLNSDSSEDDEKKTPKNKTNATETVARPSLIQKSATENTPKEKVTPSNGVKSFNKEILKDILHQNKKPSASPLSKKPIQNPNRPDSSLSTASTALAHDSDSDSALKAPTEVISKGNVLSKVAFFSDKSSTERNANASPSIQASDDDEYQFQRTQSKHKFKQNREFFEKYLKSRFSEKSDKTKPSTNDDNAHINTSKQTPVENDRINASDKLEAVRTYVQTHNLLIRIQRYVKDISKLDESRLSTMKLRSLKKILTFIRDCSNNCSKVCNAISDNVLTEFERSMSSEELLYLTMKKAYSPLLEKEQLKSSASNLNIIKHQLRVQASQQKSRFPEWFNGYINAMRKNCKDELYKSCTVDVQRWIDMGSKGKGRKEVGSQLNNSKTTLNHSQTSPKAMPDCPFTRGGVNSTIRRPYLGWRKQDRSSEPRSPHERLALSMLDHQQSKQLFGNGNSINAQTSDTTAPRIVQESIKKVATTIEHFVNNKTIEI